MTARSMVGEGVLRRDGHLYRGEASPFGIYLEVHAQVAEDEGGRFFKLQFFFDRLPAHLRVPGRAGETPAASILDDDMPAEG